MSKLFSDENPSELPYQDPNNVSLEDLVGEGRKYADANELAKALAHSQNHISNLELTQKRFESEAERMERLEKMVENLGTNAPNSDPVVTPTSGSEVQTPTEPKESPESVDFEKLISEKFGSLRAQEQADANAQKVRETMVNAFGDEDEARKFHAKRLNELGMSAEELDKLASKNPTAALKLLEVPTKQDTPAKPTLFNRPKVDRLPDPDNPTTLEDFNALRRKNFKAWSSPTIQRKLNNLVRDNN